jgi:Fur family ferric uptake transcriptional regulator
MTEIFVQHDIVKQVDFQDGKRRYEIEGEHHHHLICTNCGRVQPIHEPCIAVSEQSVKDKYGFTITRHQLEFFGICDKCSVLK